MREINEEWEVNGRLHGAKIQRKKNGRTMEIKNDCVYKKKIWKTKKTKEVMARSLKAFSIGITYILEGY